jgi:hypothetical protein
LHSSGRVDPVSPGNIGRRMSEFRIIDLRPKTEFIDSFVDDVSEAGPRPNNFMKLM